ncbi:MAG: DUF4956 domain-containing protein [Planctomycetota bacterium]
MSALQFTIDSVVVEETLVVAARLAGAAICGALVALLYRASRNPDARRAGFGHTLVLLSPLIAMVTVAVGQNVAAAFTLVGTLAIVRFRTAVRDTRDMAFVIFSVAVGMALGSLNLVIAFAGLAVIGLVVLILRRIELNMPGQDSAILKLALSPPGTDESAWSHVVARFATTRTVLKSSVDREGGTLELRLSVQGVEPDRSPQLLVSLLEIPEVVRASFAQDEPE